MENNRAKEAGMYLLMIVLNREELLDDVLSALVELGVIDATVVDSESMRGVLAYEVPIFAGLRIGGSRSYSKTIFALVEDRDIGTEIVQLLKDIDIDLLAPGAATILTVKVESALGTPLESDME